MYLPYWNLNRNHIRQGVPHEDYVLERSVVCLFVCLLIASKTTLKVETINKTNNNNNSVYTLTHCCKTDY